MNKTLIAKNVSTGLYFDGTSFEEFMPEKALALRPGTTAKDFAIAWAGKIDVVSQADEVAKLQALNPNRMRKSIAQQIRKEKASRSK